jgi:hypothetical protein
MIAKASLPKGLFSYQILSFSSNESFGLYHIALHFGLSLDTYF